jgi:hypothetical protein
MEDNVINDAVESVVDGEFVPQQVEAALKPPTPGKKPPAAWVQKLKTIGIWVGAFIGFGLVVFLLVYFLMFRPLKLAHDALAANAEQMETQLADYRTEIEAKETEISDLQAQVAGLEAENALYAEYMVYLKLLNNLASMQKAQMIGDATSMRVALANGQENLGKLLPLLSDADPSLAELLQERLALLATSDAEPEEMYQEVETIYVYLLELQETLFGDVY